MDKRFWIIIGVIVAIFGGIIWYSGNKDKKDEGNNTGDTSQESNHVTGKLDSKVKLVEFGDFECYYCGQYYPVVEQVVEKYHDKISFQFSHYPLSQTHRNAFAASRAAEAAGMQGKFWDMYRLLYANQQVWSAQSNAKPTFDGFARQLGLDMEKYNKDYASSTVNGIINADIAKFNKTGFAKATPTFVLNGKQIKPDMSVDAFSKLIDEELKKQGQQ